VPTVLTVLDAALAALRVVFLAGAIVVGVVCVVDWLVRTRRLSPFSPVSRFFRTTIDPLMAPVERRVVRSGGLPTSAPWWALAAIVFGGIVVLSLLGFLRGQLYGAMFAVQEGPRGIARLLIAWVFEILRIALIVRVVISWVRISPYSKWVRWAFVLSEPILRPLRQIIPNFGMIDITPIVAYLLLGLLQSFVVGMV
jgi:YggT family protein